MARQRRSQNGHARVPWNERWCKVCSVDGAPCQHARLASGAPRGAEDLRHFLLECPAYDVIRQQHFADVFSVASNAANADARVAAIFSAAPLAHQQRLAQCLVQMTEHRTSLGVRRRSRAAGQSAQQQQALPNPLQALDALDDELSALGFIATGSR